MGSVSSPIKRDPKATFTRNGSQSTGGDDTGSHMNVLLHELLDQAEDGYLIPCRDEDGNVDLFAKAGSGDTLLHVAVGRGRADEAMHLIGLGLDVNARGDFLTTPLHLACSSGDLAMIGVLMMAGADKSVPDSLGQLPGENLSRFTDRQPATFWELHAAFSRHLRDTVKRE